MKYISRVIGNIAACKKSHFWLFLSVLIMLTLIMMRSYYPLYAGMDFHFHFHRLQALMFSISDGTFPSYIDYTVLDGYGYFTKAFYSDFILIPFAIIGLFTNAVTAYQSLIFTVTILCGIFTYKTVNTIYKNSYAAAISSILYTFAIYRLLDIYHRAALGEAISFTFVPIVILGLYYIVNDNYKKWYVLTIGFSLMIFTHVISSVLMFVTVLIILIISHKQLIKEPKRIFYLIISGFATILITAYYVFPMLEQMYSDSFYYETRNLTGLAQNSTMELHWMVWGLFSGIIQPAQIFVPGTGLLLTCAIALRIFVQGNSKELRMVDMGVIIGLCYILATTVLFPWSVFPFNKLNFIQLPWRLYEFSSFFFAVAGGYYLSKIIKSPTRAFAALCMIIVATILVMVSDGRAYKEIRSGNNILEKPTYENGYHLGGFEYIPDKVPSVEYIQKRGNIVNKLNDSTKIIFTDKLSNPSLGHVTQFDVIASEKEILELPLLYYKGYVAYLNGKNIGVKQSVNGLVEIDVLKSGSIKVFYKGTNIQKWSLYISIASIIFIFIYYLYFNGLFNRKNKE